MALAQILKIWTWLELSIVLAFFRGNDTFFFWLTRVFPGHKETLFAALEGLELFPKSLDKVRTRVASLNTALLLHPFINGREFMKNLCKDLSELGS
jgi:hypothetical protein